MSYYKAIIYGDYLELYNYAKNPRVAGRKKRTVQSRADMSVVVDSERDGEEAQEKYKKRQGNIRHAVSSFRRLVLCNNAESKPPLLITFTYADNQRDLKIAYKDFHACIRAMRNSFGGVFRYIAVPEFQKRGAVHFHALFWGLPESLCAEERSTRVVASLWKRGFVDVFLTDGSDKLSGYLAKYMSKSYADFRLRNFKAYRCSRNVKKPVVEKDLGGTMFLNHVYGIGVDNPPCRDVEFDTQWMGKGRFRLYQLYKKEL